jgi:hypothetical protein
MSNPEGSFKMQESVKAEILQLFNEQMQSQQPETK